MARTVPARLRLAALIAVGAAALLALYAVVRTSPMFAVDRVTVVGATGATRDAIRSRATTAAGGGSLLAVSPQRVADAVAGMPFVRSVRVDRAFPHELRVTVVATGLGAAVNRTQNKPLTVVKTGTDTVEVVDYEQLEAPAVMRRRARESTVEAMRQSGVELLDIPAFLRKQAD